MINACSSGFSCLYFRIVFILCTDLGEYFLVPVRASGNSLLMFRNFGRTLSLHRRSLRQEQVLAVECWGLGNRLFLARMVL